MLIGLAHKWSLFFPTAHVSNDYYSVMTIYVYRYFSNFYLFLAWGLTQISFNGLHKKDLHNTFIIQSQQSILNKEVGQRRGKNKDPNSL